MQQEFPITASTKTATTASTPSVSTQQSDREYFTETDRIARLLLPSEKIKMQTLEINEQLESKRAELAEKNKDITDAEKRQQQIIKDVGVMEKQYADQKKKAQSGLEALERHELDFMLDLQKLETKLIEQDKKEKLAKKTQTTSKTAVTTPGLSALQTYEIRIKS